MRQTVINSRREWNPSDTKMLRYRVLKALTARHNKWVSFEWICNRVKGNPRSLGSTIRDLRRKRFGGYSVDSSRDEISGVRHLFYRLTGKQTDKQRKLKL